MLYRQFYPWPTLLNLYLTCVCPHLEYACTLWDHYAYKNIFMLESVQKFPCKVWNNMGLGLQQHATLAGYHTTLYMLAVSETSTLVQSSQGPNLFPSQNFFSFFSALRTKFVISGYQKYTIARYTLKQIDNLIRKRWNKNKQKQDRKLQASIHGTLWPPKTGSLAISVPGCIAGTSRLPPSKAAM